MRQTSLFIYFFSYIVTAVAKKQVKTETLITLSQTWLSMERNSKSWGAGISTSPCPPPPPLTLNVNDGLLILFDESYPGFPVLPDSRCILIKHI